MVKNPLAIAGDTRDMGLISGLGRSPGVGNGNLPYYSCMRAYTHTHKIFKWLKQTGLIINSHHFLNFCFETVILYQVSKPVDITIFHFLFSFFLNTHIILKVEGLNLKTKKTKLLSDGGLMWAMIHPEAKILWLSCKPFENVAYNGSADTILKWIHEPLH